MATDVQHIINVSLSKIMASRKCKGGINLHRNLLVASVLFRAKDAYIAETVAKRKRDMDSEAIVPTFHTSEEEDLPDAIEDMEADVDTISKADSTCEDADLELDDLKCAVEKLEGFEDDYMDNEISDCDIAEQCSTSEIEQLDNLSGQCDFSVNTGKPQSVCSRKRRSSVLDRSESEVNTLACSSDIECNQNTISENSKDYNQDEPCSKISRFQSTCDTSYNSHSSQQNNTQNTTTYTNTSFDWDSSDDDDDDDDVRVIIDCKSSSYIERDNGNCYSEAYTNDSHSFLPQVNMSCSNLLIATM